MTRMMWNTAHISSNIPIDMNTKHRDILASISEETFINNCLEDIKKVLYRRGGKMKIGSCTIFTGGQNNDKVYLQPNNNEAAYVELYSEEGYSTTYDIANMADVVEDADKCYNSGRETYSVLWNIKHI